MLAKDNDLVEHFPPERANQPFGICILPWRSRCGWSIVNAVRAKPRVGARRTRLTHPRISGRPWLAARGDGIPKTFGLPYCRAKVAPAFRLSTRKGGSHVASKDVRWFAICHSADLHYRRPSLRESGAACRACTFDLAARAGRLPWLLLRPLERSNSPFLDWPDFFCADQVLMRHPAAACRGDARAREIVPRLASQIRRMRKAARKMGPLP